MWPPADPVSGAVWLCVEPVVPPPPSVSVGTDPDLEPVSVRAVVLSSMASVPVVPPVVQMGTLCWWFGISAVVSAWPLTVAVWLWAATEGDLVRIVECRPLSRQKRWRLVEIVEKAK